MIFDTQKMEKPDVYRLLTHTVVPRPIAWVLTENENGTMNLAPFSYFNIVCSDPALLMFSIGHKRDGRKKDTWSNLEQRGHCTVHIANSSLVNAVNETARSLPSGESELERIDETLIHNKTFKLPRLVNAPVAFDCNRYDIHLLGNGPQAVIYVQVNNAYVADDILDEGNLLANAKRLDPLARLGGNDYSLLGDVLTITRPE